jgi:hypothetical protein
MVIIRHIVCPAQISTTCHKLCHNGCHKNWGAAEIRTLSYDSQSFGLPISLTAQLVAVMGFEPM